MKKLIIIITLFTTLFVFAACSDTGKAYRAYEKALDSYKNASLVSMENKTFVTNETKNASGTNINEFYTEINGLIDKTSDVQAVFTIPIFDDQNNEQGQISMYHINGISYVRSTNDTDPPFRQGVSTEVIDQMVLGMNLFFPREVIKRGSIYLEDDGQRIELILHGEKAFRFMTKLSGSLEETTIPDCYKLTAWVDEEGELKKIHFLYDYMNNFNQNLGFYTKFNSDINVCFTLNEPVELNFPDLNDEDFPILPERPPEAAQ